MLKHTKFNEQAIVHAGTLEWLPSPMPGVRRRMLDRLGEDGARATSIVSYAPGSVFSAHTHGGGEEFLVLSGVFQDEHGDYPAGTYVRNPPTSCHTPGAAEGCVIFVKLGQYAPEDRTYTRIDTGKIGRLADPERPGVLVTPLYQDQRETVQLEAIAAGTRFTLGEPGGYEMLVLEGEVTVDGETFYPQSWLRLPPGKMAALACAAGGAKIWVKTRHLRHTVLESSAYAIQSSGVKS